MLSGRYRTRQLTSNWSAVSSCCPSSSCITEVETLEHILLYCPEYELSRSHVVAKWKSAENPVIAHLVQHALKNTPRYLMQFILDATVLPEVRKAVEFAGPEILNPLLNLTRTWCYSVNRERLKFLGIWKFT